MGTGSSGLGKSGRKKSGGSSGKQLQSKIEAMVGKEVLVEFDNGNHPNKYPPDDPRWGTEPGTYTVYRAGDLGRESVVFTANTYKGSESYADAFPQDGDVPISVERSAVNTYTVEIKNPYVSKDVTSTYEELFGKKLRLTPTRSEINKGITTGDLWVKADERISKRLKSKGYDAWTMTDPAPPAIREMNIFGAAKKTMKKTARKVPDNVKETWKKEAQKDGFWAHAYRNGKPTGMTIRDWFKTDEYKKGKAAGKWN